MRKVITAICLGIIVSLFFYPLGFTFLPSGLNSKNVLAVLGLALYFIDVFRREDHGLNSNLIGSIALAIAFSLACFFSEVHFGTDDGSYSSYIVSFLVWVFSAYAVCYFLRRIYGTVSLKTITCYLAGVAVFQCLMSQLIARIPRVMDFVDRFIEQGQDFLHETDRLYGLGASLDSGGVRFAITLLLLSHFIFEAARKRKSGFEFVLLSLTFIGITVYGSMIARTTTLGAVLGITYIAVMTLKNASFVVRKSVISAIFVSALAVVSIFLLMSYLYVSNSDTHEQLRFAFEGFFNWVETGHFQVDSLDKLNGTMWVWPKDSTTWLIGTGRFENWVFGTDIGYCRFILYCGLLGFSLFSLFFIHNAASFHRKYGNMGIMALFLLSMTFIIWVKVSTDIFQIYALFICADAIVQDS